MIEEPQDVKVPHLRNIYEKTRFDQDSPASVRGFGFEKDGTLSDLPDFHRFTGFTFASETDRHDVAAFLLAFATGTPAAVGAQWTSDSFNEGEGAQRLETLTDLADLQVVGLVAKGRDGADQMRGWVYEGGGSWKPDRAAEPPTTMPQAGELGHEVTFTAVLEGTETRLGIDRDEDGWFDRDELDLGTDPGDPLSNPGRPLDAPLVAAERSPLSLWSSSRNPVSTSSRLGFSLGLEGRAEIAVFDLTGRRVRSLLRADRHPSGRFETVWDLRDGNGRIVAPGVYFIRLDAVQGSAGGRVVVVR
jgi:hypothetical protein